VVAVICDLIEHVFAAGIHAKKPVESVSGFVEYIRGSIRTGETACVEFIAERFWYAISITNVAFADVVTYWR
jgi:hypothetical protein